jgi:hypothetical protein
MYEPNLTTSWMWTFEGQIRGLRIDTDRGLLQWHDNFECACVDDEGSFAEQTLAEYLAQGAPAVVGELPTDVRDELAATTAALEAGRP